MAASTKVTQIPNINIEEDLNQQVPRLMRYGEYYAPDFLAESFCAYALAYMNRSIVATYHYVDTVISAEDLSPAFIKTRATFLKTVHVIMCNVKQMQNAFDDFYVQQHGEREDVSPFHNNYFWSPPTDALNACYQSFYEFRAYVQMQLSIIHAEPEKTRRKLLVYADFYNHLETKLVEIADNFSDTFVQDPALLAIDANKHVDFKVFV